jgi:membrane protease YdiL (CAAX protease family)
MEQSQKQHPFITILFLYIGVVVTQRIGSFFVSLFSDNVVMHKFGENMTGLVYVIIVISLCKMWVNIAWWDIRGLTRSYLYLLPIAYIAINLGEFYQHTALDLFLGFSSRLATGFLEELLCRGLVLALLIQYYQSKNEHHYLLKSVLISSLLFGVAHFGNVIENPQAIGAIAGQVTYATFIGVGFAAVYLQTRSLLPLIVIHFGIDFMSFLTKAPGSVDSVTFMDTLPAVLVCLPLFIFGLILLNKGQQSKLEHDVCLK